ncbi:4'-phosphopantetheinyl transferase superfamily protein [Oxalobacteraceae bacterium A2-2]
MNSLQQQALRLDPGLPYLGRIASYQPGRGVRFERELDLENDLYLADHHVVPALPYKPLAACYPLLPMGFSLEIMAEAAACLAPGMELAGLADVSATRWIALADSARLALRVEASVLDGERVAVAIRAGNDSRPSVSGTVCLARRADQGASGLSRPGRSRPGPSRPGPSRPGPSWPAHSARTVRLDGAALYDSGELFQGSRLRCLDGDILCGANGASASLLPGGPDGLFRDCPRPGLLAAPLVLDGVAQLVAVWALRQRRRTTFPIGLGRLEYHAAAPPPGVRLPLRIRCRSQGRVLSTDAEIGDGAGGLWLRIQGWRSWQFNWDARLLAFRRQPRRQLLSRPLAPPPGLDGAPVLQRLDAADVADIDRSLLARHYLRQDEMAAYQARGSHPLRQLDWLLGRIAAKDAARALAAQADGLMPHPAAFAVGNDEQGRPYLAHWPADGGAPPRLSIAHSEGRALAAAYQRAVGVDIERIGARAAQPPDGYSSRAERALLPPGADGGPDTEWLTRLWGAKEALGKLAGIAVRPDPHAFTAVQRDGGRLRMRHAASGRTAWVDFVHDGDYICAIGLAAPPLASEQA